MAISGTQTAGKIIRATGVTTQAWVDPIFPPSAIVGTAADAGKPLVVSNTAPHNGEFGSINPDHLVVDGTPVTGQAIVRSANGYEWGTPSIVLAEFESDTNSSESSGVTTGDMGEWPDHLRHVNRIPTFRVFSRLHSANSGGTSVTGALATLPNYTTGTQVGGSFNGRNYYSFTTPAIDDDTPGVEVRIYVSTSASEDVAGYTIANSSSVLGWFEYSYYVNEAEIWTPANSSGTDAARGRGAGSSWVTLTLNNHLNASVFSSFEGLRAIAPVFGAWGSESNNVTGPQHPMRSTIDNTASGTIPVGNTAINYQIGFPDQSQPFDSFRFRYPSNSYQLKKLIGII